MLASIIEWSIKNRFIVIILFLFVIAAGFYSLTSSPVDAIPDLSDVQVIVYTEYPGQSPTVVQDQVTYPLTSSLISLPHAKAVRGYSYFGFSLVYIVFDDGTDLYWARSRVLEYLNYAANRLPQGVTPTLGPDATPVGWVYEYALRSDKRSLADLRSIQDFYLKYGLSTVPGVSEVASVGGFVKEWRATLDPRKLLAYHISPMQVMSAIKQSNNDVGGEIVDQAGYELMIRGLGYIKSVDDMKKIPLGMSSGDKSFSVGTKTSSRLQTSDEPMGSGMSSGESSSQSPTPGPEPPVSGFSTGTPILLGDVADVNIVAAARRGVADLNGEGDVVGGIVEMRYGQNALRVINGVKEKLNELKQGLPPDVQIVTVYDRSVLITRAINNLQSKLIEESIIVALVCLLFLFHLRSGFVAILTLPTAILMAFIVMRWQGINANIMSLAGIAVAIGAMVDSAIIMIENAHKHIEADDGTSDRWKLIAESSKEVGPSLFYSLLVITVSFVPVFALTDQSGRLFKPLAFTKTYSIAAAALLGVTAVPILMGYFIRGKIPREEKNPINRILIKLYSPLLDFVLKYRKYVLIAVVLILAITVYPYMRLGSEFMPPLWEGTLLYMPSAFPGVSVTQARQTLEMTDKIIKQFPEVENVFGKAGRANTALDPAGFDMFETTVNLKPESEWPKGMTPEKLKTVLDDALQVPGLSNVWTMPIKNRVDMTSTGIKSQIGIKVSGPNLDSLQFIGGKIEALLKQLPETLSAFAERVGNGNYIDFAVNRDEAARYGVTVQDIEDVLQGAVGGMPIGQIVSGVERYPITVRYALEMRDNPEELKRVLIPTSSGGQIPLGEVADLSIHQGPMFVRTEGVVPTIYVFIDANTSDIGGYVSEAKQYLSENLNLPDGYFVTWSGQFEFMQEAARTMMYIIPATLVLIFLIIYLNTRSMTKTLIVMLAVPFSLVGAIWFLYLLGYNISVAVAVGMIALAGLDAETGVVMLLYLDIAFDKLKAAGKSLTLENLKEAIYEGAVRRVRPKMMTASAILAGLIPIMWSTGSGADVMKRIAAPMVGGVVTSVLLELAVYPVIYYLWRRRELERNSGGKSPSL
ncbi:MAG TPA: CusA/CzcA family heavy metal efflux RND transporter [Candidatus Acidoferrales bacterium]|nr:CusA/CzcA family heavy metal efflux RND transporter [Candidatus Acidoferrales bacterium]